MTTPAVVVERAAARVAGRLLWSDLSLTVPPGELLAVVGPNGAGKSTFLAALLGLRPLTQGWAELAGRPPGRAGALVGFVPQRRSFDRQVRIRGVDVVRLGLDGTRWGLPIPALGRSTSRAARTRARVAEVMADVGAEGFADRPIGQLSGGEQQRLSIAQALASRPRVLVLDEPLDSLDEDSQAAVSAVVGRVRRDEGVAVVMVTHDLARIGAAGPPEQVLVLDGARSQVTR